MAKSDWRQLKWQSQNSANFGFHETVWSKYNDLILIEINKDASQMQPVI